MMNKTPYYLCYMCGLWLFVSCTTNTIDEGEVVDLPPIVELVTYDDDVASIINANCVSCHSGPSATAGLRLDGYANVRASAENGNMVARMNNASNPMPPSGQLPPATLQIIDQWVADGFLEN